MAASACLINLTGNRVLWSLAGRKMKRCTQSAHVHHIINQGTGVQSPSVASESTFFYFAEMLLGQKLIKQINCFGCIQQSDDVFKICVHLVCIVWDIVNSHNLGKRSLSTYLWHIIIIHLWFIKSHIYLSLMCLEGLKTSLKTQSTAIAVSILWKHFILLYHKVVMLVVHGHC